MMENDLFQVSLLHVEPMLSLQSFFCAEFLLVVFDAVSPGFILLPQGSLGHFTIPSARYGSLGATAVCLPQSELRQPQRGLRRDSWALFVTPELGVTSFQVVGNEFHHRRHRISKRFPMDFQKEIWKKTSS